MKLVLDFAAARIGIEGDGEELLTVLQLARQIAPSLAQIEINTVGRGTTEPHKTPQKQGNSSSIGQNGTGQSAANASGQTVRQFVRGMKFDNTAERIAAVAYYKKTYEGADSFSPKEMANWFSVCGFQKPTQMSVAIFTAGKKYDYVRNLGHAKWALTTNGENLVIGKQNEIEED
ncbi:MAG: hypothetical protein HYX69_00715 [Planctomycetia bacterium]|nr:hypothetical protein [Planctomycetia bacterium]